MAETTYDFGELDWEDEFDTIVEEEQQKAMIGGPEEQKAVTDEPEHAPTGPTSAGILALARQELLGTASITPPSTSLDTISEEDEEDEDTEIEATTQDANLPCDPHQAKLLACAAKGEWKTVENDSLWPSVSTSPEVSQWWHVFHRDDLALLAHQVHLEYEEAFPNLPGDTLRRAITLMGADWATYEVTMDMDYGIPYKAYCVKKKSEAPRLGHSGAGKKWEYPAGSKGLKNFRDAVEDGDSYYVPKGGSAKLQNSVELRLKAESWVVGHHSVFVARPSKMSTVMHIDDDDSTKYSRAALQELACFVPYPDDDCAVETEEETENRENIEASTEELREDSDDEDRRLALEAGRSGSQSRRSQRISSDSLTSLANEDAASDADTDSTGLTDIDSDEETSLEVSSTTKTAAEVQAMEDEYEFGPASPALSAKALKAIEEDYTISDESDAEEATISTAVAVYSGTPTLICVPQDVPLLPGLIELETQREQEFLAELAERAFGPSLDSLVLYEGNGMDSDIPEFSQDQVTSRLTLGDSEMSNGIHDYHEADDTDEELDQIYEMSENEEAKLICASDAIETSNDTEKIYEGDEMEDIVCANARVMERKDSMEPLSAEGLPGLVGIWPKTGEAKTASNEVQATSAVDNTISSSRLQDLMALRREVYRIYPQPIDTLKSLRLAPKEVSTQEQEPVE